MSNPHENSIFGKLTSRAAGKRQIKPTAVLFETLVNDPDSDEEDEDFEVKMDFDSNGSTASESASDEDEEEEEEKQENEISGNDEPETSGLNENTLNQPICGVCVNRRIIDDKDEFMQCDSCGIYVHESCYSGVIPDDNDDEKESKTTLWFCEPCIYGLKEPPFCEFCPNRFGAFKRTDVGGRWVHLACAMFTPGISFSVIDLLTGVSWQEVGNSIFGKKACSICKDNIAARTGISTNCESGMCKDHLHVTCAQKLGLLVDETDEQLHHNDEIASVLRYFFCKKHSNIENSKAQQKIYSIWEKQENKRITINRRRKPLTEEENAQREKLKIKLEMAFHELNDVTINIPTAAIEKPKRARLLNTSAEFYDRFETKAEDTGVSREEFRSLFFDISTTNTSQIPVGFSKEFLDYMNLRETVFIPDEEEKLTNVRESLNFLKGKQQKMSKSKENQLIETIHNNDEIIEQKAKLLNDFCLALSNIGEKNEFSALLVDLKDDLGVKNTEKEIVKSDRKKMEKNAGSKKSNKTIDTRPKNCGECKSSEDQHKMAECDQCHIFYHIGCLNPPLTKVPKRTATYGWICHECNDSDDEDEEEDADKSDSLLNAPRTTRSRRPPVRHSSFLEH